MRRQDQEQQAANEKIVKKMIADICKEEKSPLSSPSTSLSLFIVFSSLALIIINSLEYYHSRSEADLKGIEYGCFFFFAGCVCLCFTHDARKQKTQFLKTQKNELKKITFRPQSETASTFSDSTEPVRRNLPHYSS